MELENRARDERGLADELADRVLAWQQELPQGPLDPDAGANDYPWPRSARA
jgi:hypothetical protein